MTDWNCPPEESHATALEKLRREFDRVFEAAVSQGEKTLDALGLRGGRSWPPPIDVVETADDVLVDVELPGVEPSSVEVALAGNMLTIKGTGPELPAGEGRTVHVAERRRGQFSRSIPLPAPVNPEKVAAEASHGVLRIRLAKAERAKPRSIRVNAPSAPAGSAM